MSWYTWLEQGRDVRISGLLLDNLARALDLSADERVYLFDLAEIPLPSSARAPETRVPADIRRLMNRLEVPCYLLNQRWDRIGWNQATIALMGDFSGQSLLRRNTVWRAYLDVEARDRSPNWRQTAQRLVAEFFAATNRYADKSWMHEFIQLMQEQSEEFREDWGRRNVAQRFAKSNVHLHPVLGKMQFTLVSLRPTENPELMLTVLEPANRLTAARFATISGSHIADRERGG